MRRQGSRHRELSPYSRRDLACDEDQLAIQESARKEMLQAQYERMRTLHVAETMPVSPITPGTARQFPMPEVHSMTPATSLSLMKVLWQVCQWEDQVEGFQGTCSQECLQATLMMKNQARAEFRISNFPQVPMHGPTGLAPLAS